MSAAAFAAPADLVSALEQLAHATQAGAPPTILAGGTDLWPMWSAAGARPERVLSLHRLTELASISDGSGVLRIGALATHAALARSEAVRRSAPAVAEAASTIGAVQVQNRGTVGGNLVNASPAADLPPPLVAAGAEVELQSVRGTRRVAVARFFTGYRQIDRAPDELLTAVLVPLLPSGAIERLVKVGTRQAQAISKVVGACRLELDRNARITRAGIAFGSVGPTVVRLQTLEQWLVGRRPAQDTAEEAASQAASAVLPIDDLRSSAAYRRHVVARSVYRWILGAV